MNRRAPMMAVLIAGLVIAAAVTATGQTSRHRSHSSRDHAATQPPARIACTVLGCQPIPAACTPMPGRTWSGLPTGYDVIVCPPGVSPLR